MAKRTLVREQEQFLVRLPDGMRDRIKAKADRAGMSMNEAIVWCLEQHFPAPATLQDRLSELSGLVAILAQSEDARPGVERLVDEVQATLDRVLDGKIPAGADFQAMIRRRLEEWHSEKAEDWENEHISPFDEETPIVRKIRGGPKPD